MGDNVSGTDRNKVLFKEEININVKGFKEIIGEMEFETDDDALLCESIITSLERYAAQKIKEEKIVQLPIIGVLRKNPIKKVLKESRSELKMLRKTNDKETYKNIIREKVYNAKMELKKLDEEKVHLTKLKSIYKKEYETFAKTIGTAFADMFIYSKTLFKYVPFDREVQRMYDELKDNNK